jgi:uncharacterized cupredoxin-like copper-binding protein
MPALAVGVALAAAACSSASQPAQGAAARSANEIRLVTTEWKFEPGTLRLPAGQPMAFLLDNRGALEHDILVPALGVHVHAQARQAALATVMFEKAGRYDFECTLPGHKEAGMKGTLVVE